MGHNEGGMDLEALAEELVRCQIRVGRLNPPSTVVAEQLDEAAARLRSLLATGGEKAVTDHVAMLRRRLDEREFPAPPTGSEPVSLWAAGYLWASLITTLAGYTPADRAAGRSFEHTPDPGPTVARVLLAHAITSGGRAQGLRASTVTGPAALASVSLHELAEEFLDPDETIQSLIDPYWGETPGPGETGFAQLQEILAGLGGMPVEDQAQEVVPGLVPADDARRWFQVLVEQAKTMVLHVHECLSTNLKAVSPQRFC